MNDLNTELQPLDISRASQPDLGPARRYIVPVTSPEADLTLATRRVWELASASGTRIKFIGLCTDPLQESSLRRALVTLSAMMNNDSVQAETEILPGRDLVGNLKSRLQSGDMVVCLDGQYTGLLQKPLHRILESDPDLPLYVFPRLSLQNEPRPDWLTQSIAWIGSLGLIAGFFMLQVKVDHLAQGWAIVLQILTTAVEFWLLWAWNTFFK